MLIGSQLSLASREHHGWLILRPDGRLTADTSQVLWNRLTEEIEAGRRKLVIELDVVRFLDSVAVALLIRINHRLVGQGGVIRLAHPSSVVTATLKIVSISSGLQIFDTVEQATAG